jgi:hypothetical protein
MEVFMNHIAIESLENSAKVYKTLVDKLAEFCLKHADIIKEYEVIKDAIENAGEHLKDGAKQRALENATKVELKFESLNVAVSAWIVHKNVYNLPNLKASELASLNKKGLLTVDKAAYDNLLKDNKLPKFLKAEQVVNYASAKVIAK